MVIGIKREYSSNCDFCWRILYLEANNSSKFQRRGVEIWRRMKWSKEKAQDRLEDLPWLVKRHFVTPSLLFALDRASIFWGRKHRIEGDIQVRFKAYWIRRALWLAWLGNELYLRFICSLARLGKRVWNRTAWARRFIRDYWIEEGLAMKKPNTQSFAAMDVTSLTSRDTKSQQSIILQKKPLKPTYSRKRWRRMLR